MKKIIAMVAFTVIAGSAAAMPPPGPGPELLADWLQLSAEQKQEIDRVFEEQEAKHHDLRDEMHQRLSQVLTEEQLARFDSVHRRGHHKCDRNGDR